MFNDFHTGRTFALRYVLPPWLAACIALVMIGCGEVGSNEGSGEEDPNSSDDSCEPESDLALCLRQDQCGVVTLTDQCGNARQIDCCAVNPGNSACTALCLAACIPESDAVLCDRNGAQCGIVVTSDNCALSREIECGGCEGGSLCGGGGVANQCGPGLCTEDGWCRETVPDWDVGDNVLSLWAGDDSNLYVAGGRGLSKWHRNPSGVEGPWQMILDAEASSLYRAAPLVWGLSRSIIFVGTSYEHWAGDPAYLFQLDEGDEIATIATQSTAAYDTFTEAWGANSNDVWFVSKFAWSNGSPYWRLNHWDGLSLTPGMNAPANVSINAVHGIDADNIWAGFGDVLWHYDGIEWTEVLTLNHQITGIFTVDDDTAWFVGRNLLTLYDEGNWSETEFIGDWKAIDGESVDSIYVAGTEGRLAHFDGTQWTLQSTGTTGSLYAVYVVPGGNVVAGGADGLLLRKAAQ